MLISFFEGNVITIDVFIKRKMYNVEELSITEKVFFFNLADRGGNLS